MDKFGVPRFDATGNTFRRKNTPTCKRPKPEEALPESHVSLSSTPPSHDAGKISSDENGVDSNPKRKSRTCGGILSVSGGNGFAGFAGGRIFVNVFRRRDDQTFFAHDTDTPFFAFPNQPCWTSVDIQEYARATVPLRWSRVQVQGTLSLSSAAILSFGLPHDVVSNFELIVEELLMSDSVIKDSGICGMDDDYVSALACLHDTIPSFDFSVFTNKDTAPSKAQQTLASALFSEMVKDMKVHFDMTMRQKAVFECLRAPHAQDFLLAIPIDGLDQHMSPVEYRTILKYHLMIPLFPVDAICHVCRKACLDSFGEHAVHCKELPCFKYRHDMVRGVLFYICRRAGISAKKETPLNFLIDPSDGRSTLRPSDVLVFGWVGGKHACVDLTGVSPLVGLSSQAALKVASCKVAKHEKACIENQHVFWFPCT
ncbi:hypothetical protein Tco_0421265 [Tanacetum coccineum]